MGSFKQFRWAVPCSFLVSNTWTYWS